MSMLSEYPGLHWSGCWERRPGRAICLWFVAWGDPTPEELILGAAGGYSGGATFQLECFCLDSKAGVVHLDLDEAFLNLPEKYLNVCGDAQNLLRDFHEDEPWLEYDTLYLSKKDILSKFKDDSLIKDDEYEYESIVEGEYMPESFNKIFGRLGLFYWPTIWNLT